MFFRLAVTAATLFFGPIAFADDGGELNPQPLPPIAEDMATQLANEEGELNPQPLPPIAEEELGA